jgi:hypothetical protein
MPPRGATTRRTRIHAKDKDYTLYVKSRGAFKLLVPTGRYTESLLGLVVQDFLRKPAFLAMDLSRLDAVALPLIRALGEYASGPEGEGGRMVLLNPPDKIRGLVRLVDREGKIAVAVSESDLEAPPDEIEGRLSRVNDRMNLVREMLASHPCWQLVDRESRWLCPFCVTVRPGIHFAAGGSPTQIVVNLVLRHLSGECPAYAEGATDGWPFEVLEQVIRHLDGQAGMAAEGGETVLRRAAVRATRRDGGAAAERRRRLLPAEPPTFEGASAEIYYRGGDRVAGDFYDFVRLGGRGTAIVVGDVFAEGAESGIVMGMARKAIRMRLGLHEDLSEALASANDDLCEEMEGENYITAAVALLDRTGRNLRLARAGHVAPFLAREGKVRRLEPAGPVLGLVPTASFEEGFAVERHELRSGDVLLLHTDGLEERRDAAGDRFGADRIAAVVRTHAHRDASLVLGALVLEAEQFAGERVLNTDATAICIKVK